MVPKDKFILIQNRPSYANPYGSKLFYKLYWPVTFKRNGLRWWTQFIEKSGQDTIDEFQAEIDKSKSYEDAADRILNRHKKQFKHRSKLAEILDNLRYVAASAGASNAKK